MCKCREESTYKCIKDFWLEEVDDNGSVIDGSWEKIKKGSLWKIDYIRNLCGGDIRMYREDNKSNYSWIEISIGTFNECFKITKGE